MLHQNLFLLNHIFSDSLTVRDSVFSLYLHLFYFPRSVAKSYLTLSLFEVLTIVHKRSSSLLYKHHLELK